MCNILNINENVGNIILQTDCMLKWGPSIEKKALELIHTKCNTLYNYNVYQVVLSSVCQKYTFIICTLNSFSKWSVGMRFDKLMSRINVF